MTAPLRILTRFKDHEIWVFRQLCHNILDIHITLSQKLRPLLLALLPLGFKSAFLRQDLNKASGLI